MADRYVLLGLRALFIVGLAIGMAVGTTAHDWTMNAIAIAIMTFYSVLACLGARRG